MSTLVGIYKMLARLHGRCKLKMYFSLKPVKYGLKIMCLI